MRVFMVVRIAIQSIVRDYDMKNRLTALLENPLLLLFLHGVIIETAFYATAMALWQMPPDSILDSGLKEILMVFEG